MMMTKGRNDNHPKKGSSIKVLPIRSLEAIQAIKLSLHDQPRNLCLFTLGINTAYRANELLSITVGQVKNVRVGDALNLKQSKTNSYRMATLNSAAVCAVELWLSQHPRPDDGAPLFLSQRSNQALGVEALNRLVKQWCVNAGLVGNYGSHSLRKTWGYQQRVLNNASVALLMRAFGHATEAQTLEYLGIVPDEIKSLYLSLAL